MLRTIEARYDHGRVILLEDFPKIERASLLITILDGDEETDESQMSKKVSSFTKSLRAVAGTWKDKKMDVDVYVREMRKDREI